MTGTRVDQQDYTPEQVRAAKAVRLFQVMAIVVGCGLLLLLLEMVLKYGFGNHLLDWWAMPHGFIYMIYMGTVLHLSSAIRMRLLPTVGVMLAGCVPFLSFYVEHLVTRSVRRQYGLG